MSEQPKTFAFDWPEEQVRTFCHRWKIDELSIFGSALRDDFSSDSDVDLLARFAIGAEWSVFDHARMESELGEIFGRKVDLVTRLAVEESPNRNRRAEILRTAQPVYAV